MTNKKILLGSALCMIASISWGAMFPVAHRSFELIHPFYFSVIRYGVVSILLAVLLLWKEGRPAFRLDGRGKALLFYGTMAFTVYNLLVFLGQHHMGESGTVAASISEALMPMISVLLLWITTGSKPSHRTLATVFAALAGALLVITKGDFAFYADFARHSIPIALIFTGVVGWVIYSYGSTQFGRWSALRYSTLTCLLGTAVSLVITTCGSMLGILPVPSVQQVFMLKYELGFMIVFPGLIALLGWNAGLKMISSVNGILFINLVPITTFVIMALQGYQITPAEVCGTVLIVAALTYNSMSQKRTMGRSQAPSASVHSVRHSRRQQHRPDPV